MKILRREEITLREPIDVQRAHDILHALCVGEVPSDVQNLPVFHAAHDALGWALGHRCGDTFADDLRRIEASLLRAGYAFREARAEGEEEGGS